MPEPSLRFAYWAATRIGGFKMKKLFLVLTMAVVAMALMGQSAEAARKKRAQVVVQPAWGWWWTGPWTVRDPRLAASNVVVGGAATAAYFSWKHNHTFGGAGGAYGVSSAACTVVSPIVGTVVTGRQLTQREVWVSMGNCFVPFVGGWAMNNWFDRNGWK